jgi:sugar/nucleoside kinase (ribokinase family)
MVQNVLMADILVAGEINPDLILTGDVTPEFGQVEKLVDDATLAIGSSSAIFACGAARLGLQVRFIGVCGDDAFGRFMLAEMQKRAVDVSGVIIRKAGRTGLSVILARHADRAILTHPGLIPALRAEDIPEAALRAARHLHVASFFLQTGLQSGLPDLFQRAHALGLSTSLDPNWDPSGEWRGFDELLRLVDVFLPNEHEAKAIARADDLAAALEYLASRSRIVAVKRGADGAALQTREVTISLPPLPVEVADTIGAGDSFDAGFLYGFLKDWDLEKSLQLAAACGALSAQKRGGTDGQPTLEEALQRVPG